MKSIFIHFIVLLILGSINGNAQQLAIPEPIDCYTSEYNGISVLRSSLENQSLRKQPGSQIEVEFVDFPENAKAAFEKAIEIWESYVVSTVPIKIKATWSGDLANNTLARSSASRIVSNFSNAPYSDVWYVIPLAEALAGKDLNNGDVDITIALNRRVNWYVGIEGSPSVIQYDLVSIALHEIAHGLGFSSSFKITNTNEGTWGQSDFPYVYDLFVQTSKDQKLVSPGTIANPSNDLLLFMEGNDLYFDIFDPVLGLTLPKLQSFAPFEIGKSISHLDENFYPNGNENSLMTPNIGPGELIRDPGIRSLSILEQIGWTIKNISAERPLAQIEVQNKVVLFPIPTLEKLTVHSPSIWKGNVINLTISDMTGRYVFQKQVELINTTFDISVEHLQAGSYILQIQGKLTNTSKRFIKL
jgi:hypothetical protein